MLTWIACIVGAYLVGAIPFGVLIANARGVNIREHGSKNIGATNVGRVIGKKWGLICFLLDVGKGAVPVLVTGWLTDSLGRHPAELETTAMWWWMGVAAASVMGHMASIYLAFAGGKGVATSFGAMLAMWALLTFPALAAFFVWAATVRLTRYVSLASVCGAISLPVLYAVRIGSTAGDEGAAAAILHASPPLIVTALLAAMVVWRHRSNLARLQRGEEPKIGQAETAAVDSEH